jgi:hypothetical protein
MTSQWVNGFRMKNAKASSYSLRPLSDLIMLPRQRQFCFFSFLVRPVAELISEPRFSGLQLRQSKLFPESSTIFHEFFPRQRNRWIRPIARRIENSPRHFLPSARNDCSKITHGRLPRSLALSASHFKSFVPRRTHEYSR